MDDTLAVTRVSPARVAAVTVGLSAAGAVFGGVAGACAAGIAFVADDGFATALRQLGVLWLPGMIGAGLGVVLAPLAGWLLLRDVPLYRVFRGLTIGTVIGGVAGWFGPPPLDNRLVTPIITAAIGFVISAVLMRLRRNRRKPGDPVIAG